MTATPRALPLTLPLDLASARAPAREDDVQVCPEGSVNVAAVLDAGRLVVVLRALADPDVVVQVPVTDQDAEHLIRALADSLRYLRDARGCPACDPHWDRS